MNTDTETFQKNLTLATYVGAKHEDGTAYVRFPDFGENVYINDTPQPTEEGPMWDPNNEQQNLLMVEKKLDEDGLRDEYMDRLQDELGEEWERLQAPLSDRADVAYGLLCEVAAAINVN